MTRLCRLSTSGKALSDRLWKDIDHLYPIKTKRVRPVCDPLVSALANYSQASLITRWSSVSSTFGHVCLLSGIPDSNRVSSSSPEFLATGGETWIQGHASIHKNARSVDVVRLIGG
jgi:hypothetical protein